MAKKLYKLRIDPEFHDLIPPLSEEEYKMLEESIVRDGCDTPLVVWKGTIVDGHNRYEICQKNSIPFAVEEKEFEDNDEAMFWMLERQLGRRNLNSFQRSELALKFAPMLQKIAKKNQGTRNDLNDNFRQNSAESSSTSFSATKMAEMAGVSHDTIKKVKKISNEADEDTKKDLRAGKISIHKAYSDIKAKEHEGETRVCECCGKEKNYSDFDLPSNSTNYRPICKECEARIKEEEAREADPSITGLDVKDGQLAHVFVGLPDTPEEFKHVVSMLQSAQNYYISAVRSLIGQYHHNMITKQNTALLKSMIDETTSIVEEMFDAHIKEEK